MIGINAQIRSSGTGSGFEGVGFAVPIDSARRSMEQLLATGARRYAYVGITTEDLTPAIATKFGYAATRGALVDVVNAGRAGARRPGSQAGTRDAVYEGLGVKVGGDAIVAIDGIPVTQRRGRRADRHRAAASRARPRASRSSAATHAPRRRRARSSRAATRRRVRNAAGQGDLAGRREHLRRIRQNLARFTF